MSWFRRSGGNRRLLVGLAIAAAIALVAAATALLAGVGIGSRSATPAGRAAARRAAEAFFAHYVRPDGRVVRLDQGGDTVSEGQAYAMLLAVSTKNPKRFESVWTWTYKHLLLPDGLLAYHWAKGRVVSASPAADADLDTAWALALAARKFSDPRYATSAKAMAGAIIAHESVISSGHRLLVAGPWATSVPAVVDPSYFSPQAFAALARLTASREWTALASSARRVVADLTSRPTRLPPNWATVSPSFSPKGVAAPGQSGPPTYGLDAARTEVWDAASCRSSTRARSAAAWPLLELTALRGSFPISMTPQGRPLSQAVNPLIAVADAAAAGAAGQRGQADRLMKQAAAIDRHYPTYYGSAWVALGFSLLDTSTLGSCPLLFPSRAP